MWKDINFCVCVDLQGGGFYEFNSFGLSKITHNYIHLQK